MKKQFVFALAAMMLAACSKDVADALGGPGEDYQDNRTATGALLQVRTRTGESATNGSETTGGEPTTGTGEATVGYPVQIYVFRGDECQAVQTIADAGQSLDIVLAEGTYAVYALGSAGADDYTLPARDEATPSSPVALKQGRALTGLMAASAVVTLTDGGSNTVTLGLRRRTMLVDQVTISKVPSAATAVSVTIAPLCQNINIDGSFSGTGGSETVALTKQDDGCTWKSTDSAHLLPPSSQPASIAVNVTVGGTTKTYTYSCSDQLEAAYRINIVGTYTEAVGVSLTGTIEGATWQGERTISFDFDESGSSATDDPADNPGNPGSTPATFPSAGDTYQGCFVLASEVTADGESAEVTLLAPTQLTGWFDYDQAAMATAIEAALGQVAVTGISGWAVPTRNEAKLIFQSRQSIGDLTAATYLWQADGGNYNALDPTLSQFTTASMRQVSVTTVLRPVATVTVTP